MMAKKEIMIVSGGLPHGPRTPQLKSLGGSETAALSVARELSKRGHRVTLFSHLPPLGEVDHIEDGATVDGVCYKALERYKDFVSSTDVDVLIASRVPSILNVPHQARKAILWLHDLATQKFAQELQGMAWNVNEVWTVSEFHRKQVHEVTGYPAERIYAMRNGIININLASEGERPPRDPKLLYYGSRLERGFEALVMPGGIMEQLPDYRLEFSMYGKIEYLPEQVQNAYRQMLAWAEALPNVKFLGELSQKQVRLKLASVAALVYPTHSFEETSCILAREAASVECPMIACDIGALPETTAGCAALFAPGQDWDGDGPGWCKYFATAIRGTLEPTISAEAGCCDLQLADCDVSNPVKMMASAARQRTDLHWDGVAEMMEARFHVEPRSIYSQARSLIDLGDVKPAIALLELSNDLPEKNLPRAAVLLEELKMLYPWMWMSRKDAAAELVKHYDGLYGERQLAYGDLRGQKRFQWLGMTLQNMKLPKGSVVVDYGCCEGNQVMNLAGCFPDLAFVGIDHSSVLVDRARVETVAFVNGLGGNSGNQLTEIPNLRFMTPEQFKGKAEVVLLTEVLEHVIEPWLLIDKAERMVRKGGRIITTTPLGPWEAQRVFSSPDEFGNREHLWHLDKGAMRTMVGNRPLFGLDTLPHSMSQNGLVLGNLCGSWLRPDKPRKARPLNPLLKAATVPNRQIVGAAIITMNDEADILRMLKSVAAQGVRDFSIAIGPSTDRTLEMIKAFAHDNPWCQIRVIEVPRIEAGKFGFDDARNASLESLSECDWILWIDSDEELVGKMGPYIRDNAFQSYCVHQHHVTCEPRGAPIQIDKPARLFRTNKGFSFAGKVHEHAEIGGCNGGPGFTMPLPELDIMHIGYKNEVVRRGRFNRNLPFLRWDRHVNPERKLGKFLWLRDLVHQMRYAAQGQDAKAAMGFANEAVTFYDKEWEDMASFGNGLVQGFQYVSEARGFLGVGTPIDTQIAVNGTDRTLRLQGQITTPEELTKIINYSLRDECKTAGSKYR